MPWDYARRTILDLLKRAKGNPVTTGRLVQELAFQDARLLQELAAPHLKGIVAHAVSRVIREQTEEPDRHPDMPESLDMPLDQFGRDLLGALGGRNTPHFGHENAAPAPAHKAASKAHIDAIKRIAKKQS